MNRFPEELSILLNGAREGNAELFGKSWLGMKFGPDPAKGNGSLAWRASKTAGPASVATTLPKFALGIS